MKNAMVACYLCLFSGGVQMKKAITTCCHCLFSVRKKENNDNASSSSSMVLFPIFKKERKNDDMAMCWHIRLWCCSNEEGDGSLLPLPSSLVVLMFNLVVFGCL
jgi:hypothetical protein